MAKEKLTGIATPAEIEAWKAKHGDIYAIEVGQSICYLKKPDRKTMKCVAAVGNDLIRGNELLLENCWLGGDPAIKTDDSLFFGVSGQLATIIEVQEAAIKKL
jgi:hypothetical protein